MLGAEHTADELFTDWTLYVSCDPWFLVLFVISLWFPLSSCFAFDYVLVYKYVVFTLWDFSSFNFFLFRSSLSCPSSVGAVELGKLKDTRRNSWMYRCTSGNSRLCFAAITIGSNEVRPASSLNQIWTGVILIKDFLSRLDQNHNSRFS